jgi:hypothetical protein
VEILTEKLSSKRGMNVLRIRESFEKNEDIHILLQKIGLPFSRKIGVPGSF